MDLVDPVEPISTRRTALLDTNRDIARDLRDSALVVFHKCRVGASFFLGKKRETRVGAFYVMGWCVDMVELKL